MISAFHQNVKYKITFLLNLKWTIYKPVAVRSPPQSPDQGFVNGGEHFVVFIPSWSVSALLVGEAAVKSVLNSITLMALALNWIRRMDKMRDVIKTTLIFNPISNP